MSLTLVFHRRFGLNNIARRSGIILLSAVALAGCDFGGGGEDVSSQPPSTTIYAFGGPASPMGDGAEPKGSLTLVTIAGKPGERGRPLKGPLDWIKASLGSLLGAVLICLPLGVPLVWTLAQFDWSVSAALADRAFLTGLGLQVSGSIYGGIQAHRDLLARTDDERVLKHRAAFIVARWLVVLIAAFTGFIGFLGPWIGGTLIVLVYAGATVYFELFPDRALSWLNPKGR